MWSACSLLTTLVYPIIRKFILAHFTEQPVMLLGWISERKFDLMAFLSSSRESSSLKNATQLSTALLQNPLEK